MCTTAQTDEEKIRLLSRGIAPATGRSLADISAEVWCHNRTPAGVNHRSGEKILRRPLKGELYTSWYPTPLSKIPGNPIKLTAKQMRWKEKLRLLRASGKGPPKKGEGKRAK